MADKSSIQLQIKRMGAQVDSETAARASQDAAVDAAQNLLQTIKNKLPTDVGGTDAARSWEKLDAATQQSLSLQLSACAKAIEGLFDDGPHDAKSVMSTAWASNAWINLLTIGSLLLVIGTLITIVWRWPSATSNQDEASDKASSAPAAAKSTPPDLGIVGSVVLADGGVNKTDGGATETVRTEIDELKSYVAELRAAQKKPKGPPEQNVLIMVMLMGLLGGAIHLTSSFSLFVGNRSLKRSWIVYYVLMPFEGAALAPMIYLLLRVGVLSPATSAGETSGLNIIGMYAFAAMTGLFSKQAIEMLADVFSTIFKKVKAKDPIASSGGDDDSKAGAAKSKV